jgi:CheY-like chemotaxis protein
VRFINAPRLVAAYQCYSGSGGTGPWLDKDYLRSLGPEVLPVLEPRLPQIRRSNPRFHSGAGSNIARTGVVTRKTGAPRIFRTWRLQRYLANNPYGGEPPRGGKGQRAAHSILVVDDAPHIRDVVRFAFEKTGMAIATRKATEALARFDRNVHDHRADIGMPEMDGWRSAARSEASDTPICSCRRATRRLITSSVSKSAATLCDEAVQSARTGSAGQCDPAADAQ